jgi:CHAT domain-containing protein
MSTPCDDLTPYLEDEAPSIDRAAFELHLLSCPQCQAAVDDYMQLLAAGAELARRPDRPRLVLAEEVRPVVPLRATRRRRWLAACGAVASAAIVMLVLWHRPSLEDRIAGELGPHRARLDRLPYAPLDRWRDYSPSRGAQASESIPVEAAADVARYRRTTEAVAVFLARGELDEAARKLDDAAGADAQSDDALDALDALEIERGVLAHARNRPSDALRHLDGVLARSPRSGVAAWNRAVVLDELELPRAAADAMAQVAALGEPGWTVEAMQRTAELRSAEVVRAQAWRQGFQACMRLAPGALPDRAIVRANPQTCRPAFYDAVRTAASRAQLEALQPIAEELDQRAGNTAAVALLHQVAAVEPARRQSAVAAYVQLTTGADLAPEAKLRLLDQLRASAQNDLVLGAIPRSGLPGLRDEYIARARAAGDPYFTELAEGAEAEAQIIAGNPLGAELVLRRAVTDCASRDVELRCSNLHLALVRLYVTMHRPVDARIAARAGLERSRRLGLYWDERMFFDHLAEVARFDGQDALMRAYLREATLRADECGQIRYALETQAMASLEQLGFAQARRDLTAAPTCNEPPSLERARILAELARIDGTPEETAALRAGLSQTRTQLDMSAGQLAYVDAIEGRLLAARDPAAARPLLRRAIEAADRVGPYDADAVKARSDAFTALIALSAGEPDHAATLALLAEAAHTPLRSACTLGVMVDAERVLIVARGADHAIVQHFDPRGRRTRALNADALIPGPVRAALAACARVDVLALPPVFGLAHLLPAELAWSYRERPAEVTAPPAAPPRIVTVAGTVPPAELGLPPLRSGTLAPIAGAVHSELRGAQATPAAVVAAFATADAVEIHAHGYVDLGLSDASLIALSPQADGRFALGAREIARLQLPRAPLVILAACHAAYTAPFLHEPWGLPRAFLLAGARAVLASPDEIPDTEAGAFFRAVEQRILAGVDPAVALRDERVRRLARDPKSWARNVLLFD